MKYREVEDLLKECERRKADNDKWGDMLAFERFPISSIVAALRELLDYKAVYGNNPRIRLERENRVESA